MRSMFEKEGGILAEDYEHFTRPQGVSTPLSKDLRKSEKPTGKQDPKLS